MAIKHTKVVTVPDDGTSPVGTDEWNDNHTIDDSTLSIAKTTGLQSALDLKSTLASPTFTGTVVLPNVPAIVTTQLDLKSTLASPTFTGTVVLPNVPAIVTTQLDLKETVVNVALKSPLANPTFTGTVVLPNVPAIVTTQLDLKASLASPALTSPSISYAINAITNDYTTVLADAGKIITSNKGSAVVITIPPNSSVAYPIGSSINVISIGAGLTNFAIGAGVTINSTGAVPAAPVLRIAHSSATAIKIATDTWQVVGDIS